jgi:general secretion pathway protein B
MSFILDALKKLEQEKAARRNGEINISHEIVRDTHQLRRRARRSVPLSALLAAFGLVLLLGATGAFFWHKQDAGGGEKDLAAGSSQTLPAAAKTVEVSQSVLPQVPSVQQDQTRLVKAPAPAPPPVAPKRQMQNMVRPVTESPLRSDFNDRSVQSSEEDSGSGGAGIKVSGVAWQDSPSARRAVVNGQLVKEGAQVDGATVEEILPTRVRFSSGGRRFTLSISGQLGRR